MFGWSWAVQGGVARREPCLTYFSRTWCTQVILLARASDNEYRTSLPMKMGGQARTRELMADFSTFSQAPSHLTVEDYIFFAALSSGGLERLPAIRYPLVSRISHKRQEWSEYRKNRSGQPAMVLKKARLTPQQDNVAVIDNRGE